MVRAALGYHKAVFYQGFDLFEDATDEDDARELNVKPHVPVDQVRARLEVLARQHPGFAFALHKGDSRDTLPELTVDLAYIDGGHSIETIASDYARLRRSRVVVLDDWYSPDAQGLCQDISRFGCNQLGDQLRATTKRRIEILPKAERMPRGGLVHMVLITRG
jgi:hypothetical protein